MKTCNFLLQLEGFLGVRINQLFLLELKIIRMTLSLSKSIAVSLFVALELINATLRAKELFF